MSDKEKAKSVLITDYLLKAGYSPDRETAGRAWYKSPLRYENLASFVVHKVSNRWVDYGTQAHGDLIAFVMAFEEVAFSEAIRMINGDSEGMRQFNPDEYKDVAKEGIRVSSICSITNSSLLGYLKERCIDIDIAQHHCVQVKWQFTTHPATWNYGIGFRNDADGLEIRSSKFKVGNSPKTYRTIGEYTPECNVFEGFFDYLSVLTQHKSIQLKNQTYILNSLAFVHIMIDLFRGYEKVKVFFDNDPAGDDKVRVMRDEGIELEDMRHLFKGHEDYNDYWKEQCKT